MTNDQVKIGMRCIQKHCKDKPQYTLEVLTLPNERGMLNCASVHLKPMPDGTPRWDNYLVANLEPL